MKVSKIDVPSISTDWIAYRVDMKNSGQRRWTTHMCGLIKHFDDSNFVTVHPKGTKGSLYKE